MIIVYSNSESTFSFLYGNDSKRKTKKLSHPVVKVSPVQIIKI